MSRRLKALLAKPVDPSTEEGRSQERYRRAALTSLVMVAARLSNILTGLLTVPITLRYLGEDLYGVWMAIAGFVGFLSFYDFGIGTGLRNMLIRCSAEEDVATPRKLIGNALLILTLLAAFMILLDFAVLPLLPWGDLIKCKDPASIVQILPTAQAVLLMFAVGLPVSQLQNIANAYQRGYWGYLCFLLGRILGFLFVIYCVATRQPLWLLAGGYVGAPYLVSILGWVVFWGAVPTLRPWPIRPEWKTVRQLLGIGIFVLIHHLSYAMINTSGLLLIANTINAAAGVPYSVTNQLLGVSNILTASVLVSVSVAVGEAWHRGDFAWVGTTVRKIERTVWILGIVPLAALLLFARSLIEWWTGSYSAVPSFLLLLACVLTASAVIFGDVYSNSLIAMNYVRFVALTRLAAGVLVVLGGYWAGMAIQSVAPIVFVQFFVGALIPSLLFRLKMKKLLDRDGCDTESSRLGSNSAVCAGPFRG